MGLIKTNKLLRRRNIVVVARRRARQAADRSLGRTSKAPDGRAGQAAHGLLLRPRRLLRRRLRRRGREAADLGGPGEPADGGGG